MSSFPVLDLVVGMVFVYFLLSIITSSAVEMALTIFKLRARVLEDWLLKILDKPVKDGGKEVPLGQAIMDHCAITALSKEGDAPSYIGAKNFVSALLEKITYDPDKPDSVAMSLNDLVTSIKGSSILPVGLKRVMLLYANEAAEQYKLMTTKTASEIELFRNKVEAWYDANMDRITGTLKTKYARPLTIGIGLAITLALNADTLAISKYLYSNPEARAKVVAQAYGYSADSTLKKKIDSLRSSGAVAAKDTLNVQQVQVELERRFLDVRKTEAGLQEHLPLGWYGDEFKNANTFLAIISKLFGFAATVLALSMGAPFWFDLLNKIANIRGAGNKPQAANADDKNKQPL
ncbi:MAG: hypothetical protein JSS82_14230 [Bacteroidetes bacterium]|nr:hypothetical protein [Bacteroidota bacterium]